MKPNSNVSRRDVLKTALITSAVASLPKGLGQSAPAPKVRALGDLKVGTYISPGPNNHRCNTHWIETDDGLIVIDAQWVLPEAEKALQSIRAETDKPIRAIFITHDHSDHFGGLPVFVQEAGADTPVYATQVTHDSIKHDFHGFIANRQEEFGTRFPDVVPIPNTITSGGERLNLSGVDAQVLELRQNESLNTTMLYLPEYEVLFSADLVGNETIPFFWQGGTEHWIGQLGRVQDQFQNLETIYPGHGVPGSAQPMMTAELDYLTHFHNLIYDRLSQNGRVTPEDRDGIVETMLTHLPAWHTAVFPDPRELLAIDIDVLLREWRIEGQYE